MTDERLEQIRTALGTGWECKDLKNGPFWGACGECGNPMDDVIKELVDEVDRLGKEDCIDCGGTGLRLVDGRIKWKGASGVHPINATERPTWAGPDPQVTIAEQAAEIETLSARLATALDLLKLAEHSERNLTTERDTLRLEVDRLKDLREASLENAMNDAARDLPEGWQIRFTVENGYGLVELGHDDSWIFFEFDDPQESFASVVRAALYLADIDADEEVS